MPCRAPVWIRRRRLEHATVRANKQPAALDVPLPPKKRAANLDYGQLAGA